MKKLIMFFVVITAGTANAMEDKAHFTAPSGDISTLITDPISVGSNVPFSGYSDENGVCKALGFQKGAAGSIRWGTVADAIRVNSSGNVDGGQYTYTVAQIVCVNKTHTYPNEKVALIVDPKHPNSNLPVSGSSDENGTCRSLGFERAAEGSTSWGEVKDTVLLNEKGDVIAGPYTYEMSRIICVTIR